MKAYRLFVKELTADSYALSGYKIIHDDGAQHDDLQTLFASLMRYRKHPDYWLWDDSDHLTFDDGTRILL